MIIKPLADRVLVEFVKEELTSPSGLYTHTETTQERSYRATVMAVGPGTKEKPMEVQIGQHVICSKYAGAPIKIGGKDVFLIHSDDILAIEE